MNNTDKQFIIAIDIGTTSIRTLAFDVAKHEFFNINQRKLTQIYPQAGWVEQSPDEIMDIIYDCLQKTLQDLPEEKIYGLGLTNQRETTVAWDKETGKAYYNAIVWQCRRTHEMCDKMRNTKKTLKMIKSKTGLIPDSYFSATKMKWLLDNVPAVKQAKENNNLCFGTLDSFVIYNLTQGKSFVTDHSNASRTLLYNIKTKAWDDELLKYFGLNKNCLANIINCDMIVGSTTLFDKKIYIGGILGDQQSSLFGQSCTRQGQAKITYGTGAFLLVNIGEKPVITNELITTIAWSTKYGTYYALEGNMYSAGACISWLTDRMHLIDNAKDTEKLAGSLESSGGVLFIPALAGLGAPFWKSNAKAEFRGISLATTDAHLVRAVLRGISYNTRAVFDVINKYCHFNQTDIRADGGMTANHLFMQFVSDVLHTQIFVSAERESTSLGVCYMTGLCFGAYNNLDEISQMYKFSNTCSPAPYDNIQEQHYRDWLSIIETL